LFFPNTLQLQSYGQQYTGARLSITNRGEPVEFAEVQSEMLVTTTAIHRLLEQLTSACLENCFLCDQCSL